MKPTSEFDISPGAGPRPDERGFTSAASAEASSPRPSVEGNRNGQPPSRSSLEDVKKYYGGRTEHILKRYGPGPRVHYHAGLVDELEDLDVPAHILRRRLVDSQERILAHAAEIWRAASNLSGDVLDVGCGLGGGSLFWAQEFGARVTAVTCVPEHAKLVEQFADRVGVGSRVRPLVSDVLKLEGRNCFDAAVSVDASCHLPRREWFRRLVTLLRPGGRVFISDCFLGRRVNRDYEDSFNNYWHTKIGTIAEYYAAAREAGLEPNVVEDLSSRVTDFFSITRALIQIEAQEAGADTAETARCDASFREHTIMRQGLREHDYIYAQLSFSKRL
jgi:cyclopropane fatty-acyl-phospholipid synthase-like methyltransferase